MATQGTAARGSVWRAVQSRSRLGLTGMRAPHLTPLQRDAEGPGGAGAARESGTQGKDLGTGRGASAGRLAAHRVRRSRGPRALD